MCVWFVKVVIHSGSAHAGHYHAYIRDVRNEGNWIRPAKIPKVSMYNALKNRKKGKRGEKIIKCLNGLMIDVCFQEKKPKK